MSILAEALVNKVPEWLVGVALLVFVVGLSTLLAFWFPSYKQQGPITSYRIKAWLIQGAIYGAFLGAVCGAFTAGLQATIRISIFAAFIGAMAAVLGGACIALAGGAGSTNSQSQDREE